MSDLCDVTQHLRGLIGYLICSREAGHEGIHRDGGENLWWLPGAPPLEVADIIGEKNDERS